MTVIIYAKNKLYFNSGVRSPLLINQSAVGICWNIFALCTLLNLDDLTFKFINLAGEVLLKLGWLFQSLKHTSPAFQLGIELNV